VNCSQMGAGRIGSFSSPRARFAPAAICLSSWLGVEYVDGSSTSAEEPIDVNVYQPPALSHYQQASLCRQRCGSCCGR
jgi:hypothetical protein